MKLEVEITEDEIRSAIERKIRVAIADENGSWKSEEAIKEKVKKMWSDVVDEMISAALADSGEIKRRVEAEIERKIRNKLNAAIREAGK